MADRIIPEQSPRAGGTVSQNIACALSIAVEIAENNSRDCALSLAIEDGLRNNEIAVNEFRFAELLAERTSDCSQINRLIKCLKAVSEKVADIEVAPGTEFASGASATLAVVRQLPGMLAADDSDQSTPEYLGYRDAAIAAIVEAAGPMPLRAAGALSLLAEIVVSYEQDSAYPDVTQDQFESCMLTERRHQFRSDLEQRWAE